MNKLLMGTVIVIAVIVNAFTARTISLPIGSSMPKGTIKMKDVSGKIVTLNDIRAENGLLVMFSCNTCPYVIKNQSRTKEVLEYAQSKNIGVIVLNSNEGNRDSDDSFNEMQNYAKQQDYKWPYTLDSNNELADAFGANRTPECFLFDKDGILVYHGAIDDSPADPSKVNRSHLKEAINDVLTGKPIAIKESKSVGCAIKRKG